MTRPNLRSRMPGQTGCTVLNTPVRLVSITSCHMLGRHAVERGVTGDARVGHDHVDGTKVCFDLFDACLADAWHSRPRSTCRS